MGPGPVTVVDGTRKECTGVIAGLERALRDLPPGATVRALVGDLPSRVEVLAWAGRKGHAISGEDGPAHRLALTIVKGGAGPSISAR